MKLHVPSDVLVHEDFKNQGIFHVFKLNNCNNCTAKSIACYLFNFGVFNFKHCASLTNCSVEGRIVSILDKSLEGYIVSEHFS